MSLLTFVHNASIISSAVVLFMLIILLLCRFCSMFCKDQRNGLNCRRCSDCPNGNWPIKSTIGMLFIGLIALFFIHEYIHPLIVKDQLVYAIDTEEYDAKKAEKIAIASKNALEEIDMKSIATLITEAKDQIIFTDDDGNIFKLRSTTHTADNDEGLIILVEKVLRGK